MDIITLSFYAVVCGVLGLAGPRLGAAPIRLLIGGLVGVLAATILPFVHVLIGY